MKRWLRPALALLLAVLLAMGAMAEETLAPEVELGEELALNLPEDEAEQSEEAMPQEEEVASEGSAEDETLVGEGFLSTGELPADVEYVEDAASPEEAPEEDAPAVVIDEPSGVVIVNPVERLGVKENCTFRAEFANGEALGAGCVWSSDKTSVLRVVDVASGEFRGVKKGTANVTVTSVGGQTATVAVKVQAAPSKVTLSAKKGTLGAGEAVQLTAKLPKNTASQISWESNNAGVATVDSNGLVTAVTAGSAKITARTFNKKKATYSLTVKAAPTGIEVPASIALGVGQKYTLNIALSPANAAGKLRVVNSDETVVQLDKGELSAANSASVKLTASTVGNATVRFESYNGVSATCEVTVYAMPTLVNITNAVTLGKGETYQLLAESNSDEALLAQCKWKTSNKKVLQIDNTGKLTAKKKGTAKITATLPSGNKTVSKSVKIRVVDAPKGLTLNSASANLQIGGELQLTATLNPSKSASQITWTSSNEAVAQVDGNGNVTAIGGGEAIITAQTFNGQSATCAVTVASPDAPEIRVNGATASGEVPEVSDSVTLSWSSPIAAQSYNVEVAAEDGTVILRLQSTSATSATIEKAQMVSGAIYTVRVTANHGASSAASASARFKFVDPEAGQGGSTVYFTSDISAAGMMAVYRALGWSPTGSVAVKLSTGEPPASNYLRPELVKDVVQAVRGTIVECNTAYGGSRSSTAMHMQVARDHGFTDIADVDILDADGSLELPVNGGSRLQTNLVGGHFANYDSCVVLSHFKGHAMAGFGGAIKNISIGLGSQEGKCLIHTGGRSHTSPWGGDQTAFTESMAEAGKSVSDYMGNGARIVYINVLNNISIDCDCDGNPAEPDIHDIGILASTDPVAIDQASIDLCFAAEGSQSLKRRVANQNGLHTLEHAEEIGLGSRTYELVSIDD